MTTTIETKPLYTVRELAALFKRSKDSTARLLVEAGVVWTWAGNRRLVALTELESKVPEAWSAALAIADRRARLSSRIDVD